MMSGGNFKPIVAIAAPAETTLIGRSPFPRPLAAIAHDVEDEFNCCTAAWSLAVR